MATFLTSIRLPVITVVALATTHATCRFEIVFGLQVESKVDTKLFIAICDNFTPLFDSFLTSLFHLLQVPPCIRNRGDFLVPCINTLFQC